MLNPMLIAIQGIGYTAMAVSVQGFVIGESSTKPPETRRFIANMGTFMGRM